MRNATTTIKIKKELRELTEFLEQNKHLVMMQRPLISLNSMMNDINDSKSFWDWLTQHEAKRMAVATR